LVVPILGTGLPVPEGSLNRDTICVTLLGGESTTELLQLANLGQGELEYTTGVGGIGTNALVWFNPASVNQQSLDNMLSVLEDPASLLDVTVTSTINGAEMAELLENTNYLVFPDMGFIPFTIDTDIGGAILPWLQAGGKIISAGNDQSGVLTDMNLVNAFFHTGIFGDDEINVIESGHPLLENVQLPLDIVGGFSGIVGVPVNDPNTTIIVSNTFAPDEGLIFTQNNVDGEVIFLGNNYDELTQNNETILRNALTYSRVEVPFPVWLSVDNTDGTLDPGSTTDVNVTFDAGTLPGATYTFPLTYNYNQPTNNLGLIYLKMIVATAPITAFSSTNEISCDGTVNFFDESLQNPTSWEWDFGDGNGSTEQNPVHNYSANGTYTVSLTTCNELGCTTEEIVDFILVDLTNPFCLQTVFEDNESVDLNGCGGIIFSTGFPGSYPNGVSSDIHITSGNGGPLRITVNSFQLEGCCDFLRVYDGSDATATLIGEYNGTDLLPGDLIESTGGELFLTFTTDGSVTLPGFELLWQCSDAVSNVVLGAEQEQGCPATYMFEAFNGLPEYTYNWDFGDGSTTTGPGMHLHTYAGTGPYTVTLMVSNDGDEYMTQTNLNVTGLNLPLGIIGPDTVEIDQVATFEKDGTDLLNTFDWTTSDGSTGSGETFMTSWPAVGTYEVRLDAGSDEVCSAAVIKEVVVVEGVNVRDAESVNSLNLFPNPVNQTLYFELETSLVSELRYRIVDVLGRTVVESQRGLLNGGAPVAVEVGQLPASTYALVIFDGSGRRLATRRFVKQ
jgi:PKD repeat protein